MKGIEYVSTKEELAAKIKSDGGLYNVETDLENNYTRIYVE